jgi:hypothetical protein
MNSYGHITEFWTVSTKRGPRAYYFDTRQFRSFPFPHAEAELLEATGQAQRIDKPEWIGRPRGW